MTEHPPLARPPRVGDRVVDANGSRVGRVDAVFADYVLVRTRGVPPVDLYVPVPDLSATGEGAVRVAVSRSEAYDRWHRPLRKAPHP